MAESRDRERDDDDSFLLDPLMESCYWEPSTTYTWTPGVCVCVKFWVKWYRRDDAENLQTKLCSLSWKRIYKYFTTQNGKKLKLGLYLVAKMLSWTILGQVRRVIETCNSWPKWATYNSAKASRPGRSKTIRQPVQYAKWGKKICTFSQELFQHKCVDIFAPLFTYILLFSINRNFASTA